MIKINYNDNLIRISGHAKYATYGSDIVCASVSSIIYTTVNAILNIDHNSIKFIDDVDMVISIMKKSDIVDKLINNMFSLLEELEKQYPKNIKISKGE